MVNKVGVVQHIANIYEDVYVERMMSQCFPGCKQNLRRMAEIVYTEGDPDDPSPFMETLADYHSGAIDEEQFVKALWGAILNYILFRVRGHVSSKIAAYIPKHWQPVDMMMPGITAVIDPILGRVPVEGINTEANNALAVETEKAIRDFMGGEKQQTQEGQDDDGQGDSQSDGKSSGQTTGRKSGNRSQGTDGNAETDAAEEQTNGEDNQSTGQSGQEEQSTGDDDSPSVQHGQDNVSDEGTDTEGSSARSGGRREVSQELADAFNRAGKLMREDEGPDTDIAKQVAEAISETIDNSKEAKDLYTCDMNTESFGSSTWGASVKFLSDAEVKKSNQASVALDAQLQSLLQTYTLNRGGVSCAGKLDMHRLHKLTFGSDRVFNRRVEKLGINTEVVIAVDMSGSMREAHKATLTSMSLYAAMKSLRKIRGCTSSVIGFSDNEVIDILRPEDKLTTRMQIQPNGGTHCGEALVQAMRRFSPSLDSRKIVIMMTDGETSNARFFKHAIQSAKNSGIELVGIGILDVAIQHYLTVNECCIIKSLGQMTPELFRILRTKLLGRAA